MKNKDSENKSLNEELSALISGTDEFFKDVSTKVDETATFGRNSGLVYNNKYSKASGKLASNKVVDISSIKKRVEEPKIEEPPKVEEEVEEKEENLETEQSQSSDDDFDKFFEDFMRDLNSESEESEEKPIEEPKVEKPKKPRAPRKKKRAIDIDIISGGIGGDII